MSGDAGREGGDVSERWEEWTGEYLYELQPGYERHAFVLDYIPATANQQKRSRFWWAQTKTWAKRIRDVAGSGPWVFSGMAKVKTRLGITVHRRKLQDPDNAVASVKHVVDALKRTGFIVDDSWTWLELHVWEKACKAGEERTEFVIEYLQGTLTPTPAEAK